MIVNMNARCQVQLNEYGKHVWAAYVEAMTKNNPEITDETKQQLLNMIDADDNIEMTIWELIAIFGGYSSMTLTPFASTSMTLKLNPDFRSRFQPKE